MDIEVVHGEDVWKFPDVSYYHFCDCEKLYKEGESDTEYYRYLKENGMIEPLEYNNYSTDKLKLIIYEDKNEKESRKLEFECVYDSERGNYSSIKDLYKHLYYHYKDLKRYEDELSELKSRTYNRKFTKEESEKFSKLLNNIDAVKKYIEQGEVYLGCI